MSAMKASDAKATLVYYFQTVWEAAGLKWTAENVLEVEDAIDALIDSALATGERE